MRVRKRDRAIERIIEEETAHQKIKKRNKLKSLL
jgi:hypothetical protein